MTETLFVKRGEKDLTRRIVSFLSGVKENAEIIFEKGDYEFSSDGCFEREFFPLNNKSGVKKVVFPVLNAENIVIDGGGSDFIFIDRCFPFIISGCKNVILKNFAVDFSFPRYCESTVVYSDENSFTLKIDKEKFPYEIKDGAICFKSGRTEKISSDKKIFFLQPYRQNVSPAYLAAGNYEYDINGRCVDVLRCEASAVIGGVKFDYKTQSPVKLYPENSALIVSFDEDRENDVVFIENSANVRIENVDIYRGAGMGVIAQLCENIVLDGVKIKIKEGRSELFSITADGFHFVNCFGSLTVVNCEVGNTVDDNFNIHGAYMLADKTENGLTQLRYGHYEQGGVQLFGVGDEAVLYDGKTHAEKGGFRITSVTETADGYAAGGIAGAEKGDRVANRTATFKTVSVENCVFKNSPHIRISDGGKIMFKNCRVSGVDFPIYVDDLFEYYYESGFIDEFTVENCVFENFRCPLFVGVEGGSDGSAKHNKLVLRNNKFIGGADMNARISRIKRVTLENNSSENGALLNMEITD